MDILLGRLTQQAMNYAIRSGIAITSTYALRQCSRLLRTVEGDEHDQLSRLQHRLDSKIRVCILPLLVDSRMLLLTLYDKIISPAIDMIELISARGNSSLQSALALTKSLRWDIQSLGLRLSNAANAEELSRRGVSKVKTKAENELEVKQIIVAIRKILERIEDAVPLINLAITTSGANLSTNLPVTISPSRLLQASTFLTAGDTQYSTTSPIQGVQIGPTFVLSLYMLFRGHSGRTKEDEDEIRDTTWKEVMHKAQVKMYRVPLDASDQPSHGSPGSHLAGDTQRDEFAYELHVIEDLDDDRYHSDEEDEPRPKHVNGVRKAGMHEEIPIYHISKIFYADTGKILDIGTEGETNSPVLLLKRDVNAIPPRRMMDRLNREEDQEWYHENGTEEDGREEAPNDESQSEIDAQLSREDASTSPMPRIPESPPPSIPSANDHRLPPDLDPEWLAFEVYTESPDPASESDEIASESDTLASSDHDDSRSRSTSLDPDFTTALSTLNLDGPATPSIGPSPQHLLPTPSARPLPNQPQPHSLGGPVRTSLSLLETLIRLTSLQQFQQTSHLSITDELLNFFLSESSTTGAGHDGDERRRKRWEARQRLGFDPYDDSPVKMRGERQHATAEGGPGAVATGGEYYYDDDDDDEQYYAREGSGFRSLRAERLRSTGMEGSSPSPSLRHLATPLSTPASRRASPFSQAQGRRTEGAERSSPPFLQHGRARDSRRLRPFGDVARGPQQTDASLGSSSGSRAGGGQMRGGSPQYLSSLRLQPDEGQVRRRNKGSPLSADGATKGKGRGRGRSLDTDSSLGTSPGYDFEVERVDVQENGA